MNSIIKSVKHFVIAFAFTIASGNGSGRSQSNPQGEINLSSVCSAAQLSGSVDATACLQRAIDTAFANKISVVTCPSGAVLRTSSTIYEDPPFNLRAHSNKYVTSGFSMAFISPGGGVDVGAGAGGCQIRPNFSNGVAWWIGSGRGMVLRNVSIAGPPGGYRGQQNSAGIGVQVSDGASRTLIDNVFVGNFYICEQFGGSSQELADSNTVWKGHVDNCYYGLYFPAGNDDINGVYDEEIGNSTVSIRGGQPVNVYGGNFSSDNQRNTFAVSTISGLTSVSSNVWTFKVTIMSPDRYLSGGNVYDSFAIKTSHYGVVPLSLVNFNASTNIATFQLYTKWVESSYFYIDLLKATSIQTDIEDATTVYAAERVRVLSGGRFDVTGLWVENASGATTLIESLPQNSTSKVSDVFFNYDIALSRQTSNPNFYIQQVFPFIDIFLTGLEVTAITSGQKATSDRVVISGSGEYSGRLHVHDVNRAIVAPNLYLGTHQFVGDQINASAFGFGMWDETPWVTSLGVAAPNGYRQNQSIGHSAFWGYRPDVSETPCITPGQYATVSGVLPTISSGAADYPLIWGGATYRECDWYGVPARFFVMSNHHFYSYGQNLTTKNVTGAVWSYTAGSDTVYMSSGLIALMFNGLGIQLNSGPTNTTYMIKGVYPTLGYVTVYTASDTSPQRGLAGTVGTLYSGTTVGQEVYSFTTTQ